MEPEIIQFAASIGATEPSESDEAYSLYRRVFRERNYFMHSSGFLVIKLSRIKKPFWGLTREIMETLNRHFSYNLILLVSASQGWIFSKTEIIHNLESKHWSLDSKGEQYKIHPPLPDSNIFFGPKGCRKKLGVGEA